MKRLILGIFLTIGLGATDVKAVDINASSIANSVAITSGAVCLASAVWSYRESIRDRAIGFVRKLENMRAGSLDKTIVITAGTSIAAAVIAMLLHESQPSAPAQSN